MIKIIDPDGNLNNLAENITFVLRQDRWNDYSFKTQYQLFLSPKHTSDGEALLIGDVKILKKGQSEKDCHLLNPGEINNLNNEFCSLGQSLDYYQRLASLPEKIKLYILKSLNDVVYNKDIKHDFTDERGWNTSIMRYIAEDDDVFLLAPFILQNKYDKIPSIDLSFSFHTPELNSPIMFDFDSYSLRYGKIKLPSRIIALVGRNGSGKSTLLSRLSRIAYASTADRNDDVLKKIGTIEPKGLGFPKIINISYSAFDSFQIPGIYVDEKKQILSDLVANNGRYIYCGVRDIKKELNEQISSPNLYARDRLNDEIILNDRLTATYLKDSVTINNEIINTLTLINKSKRNDILNNTFTILTEEPSFKELLSDLNKLSKLESILKLSTGHKFVLHSICNILLHTEKRSLILFDEPETHLHPPLLAVLMKAIRYILLKLDAFAVIATHSPIIIQETLSRHVKIIRRVANSMKCVPPITQTYGENLNSISTDIFGFNSDYLDFHSEINKIINDLTGPSTALSDDDIIERIKKLSDGDISSQALAYILSALINRKK